MTAKNVTNLAKVNSTSNVTIEKPNVVNATVNKTQPSMSQTKTNQTMNKTENVVSKVNTTAESEVWVQPTPAKSITNKTENKKFHKNLKGVYRDFTIEKQKKFQEKEDRKI